MIVNRYVGYGNQKPMHGCTCRLCFFMQPTNNSFSLWKEGKFENLALVKVGNCWQNLLLRRLRDPSPRSAGFPHCQSQFPSLQTRHSVNHLIGGWHSRPEFSINSAVSRPSVAASVFTSCNLTSPKALPVHASWTQIQGNLDSEKGCHCVSFAVL